MKASRLVAALALAMAVGAGGAALAASPGAGSVGPSNASLSWSGKSFLAGATPSPAACPEQADPNDVLCDHFDLTAAVGSGFWDTHSGGVTVSISWGSSSDNFDLYVYKSGSLVGKS